MLNHLSFDEMADAAFINEFNSEAKALLLRVHAHTLECDSCSNTYNNLVSLCELIESYSCAHIITDKKSLVLNELNSLAKMNKITKSRVYKWMEKIHAETNNLSICIKSKLGIRNELSITQQSGFNFGFPVPIGVRSTSVKEIDKSILIDDNDSTNRIYINDNMLVIQVNKEMLSTENPYIALVSEDYTVKILELKQENDIYKACFMDLITGESYIFFE